MPVQPDLDGRQDCCGAPRPHHWEDCPVWVFNVQGNYWRTRSEAKTEADEATRHRNAWFRAAGIPVSEDE